MEGACADDALQYEKVVALISAYTEDSFLESPAFNSNESLDDGLMEAPGTVIGRYKILQPIGEGGDEWAGCGYAYGRVFVGRVALWIADRCDAVSVEGIVELRLWRNAESDRREGFPQAVDTHEHNAARGEDSSSEEPKFGRSRVEPSL